MSVGGNEGRDEFALADFHTISAEHWLSAKPEPVPLASAAAAMGVSPSTLRRTLTKLMAAAGACTSIGGEYRGQRFIAWREANLRGKPWRFDLAPASSDLDRRLRELRERFAEAEAAPEPEAGHWWTRLLPRGRRRPSEAA